MSHDLKCLFEEQTALETILSAQQTGLNRKFSAPRGSYKQGESLEVREWLIVEDRGPGRRRHGSRCWSLVYEFLQLWL